MLVAPLANFVADDRQHVDPTKEIDNATLACVKLGIASTDEMLANLVENDL